MINAGQAALLGTVAAPFLGALVIIALRNHPNARETSSFVVGIITFLLAIFNIPAVFKGQSVTVTLAVMSSYPQLQLSLWADGLGLLFAGLASFLWIITTVYSTGYMRGLKEHALTRYFACFSLVIGATMGVSLAQNLLTLFIFYEILTVSTYPLVIQKETEEAFRAGRKYLVYTLGGGAAILAGTLALLAAGGGRSITFVPGGNQTLGSIPLEFARVAFVLLFAGFGVKAALVPEHGWLPTAMVAPTPVSGLLHAVAVVKAGVFGLLRILLFLYGPTLITSLGMQGLVVGVAVITILVGSFFALTQDNFKLRLAYSTISQLSYIVLAAGVLTPLALGNTAVGASAAIIAAAFLLVAHAFGKLTMFFVAGAVNVETGKSNVSELDGIGWQMPGAMAAFFLATLSMAGLPPMAGFVGKWYLSIASWNAGYWWVLLVLAFSSVLNLAYFLPITVRAFLRPFNGTVERVKQHWLLVVPPVLTAIGTLLLGVWTTIPYGPLEVGGRIAIAITGFGLGTISQMTIGAAVPPFAFFLVGGPLAVWLLKGKARQGGLVLLAGLALIDVILLPHSMEWTIPFMGYRLVLLRVDSLSYLMGILFSIITFLAVLYAAGFAKPWMHLFAMLYAGTSMGIVFAGDWITLLVFWELTAIVSTLLILEAGGEALQAGYRYFMFHAFGGGMLAAGIALLFLQGNSPIVGSISGFWPSIFIVTGIGVNVCMIPFHTWLPTSYPKAHFAASVFLSVYSTKAAVYLLARAQPSAIFVAFMGAIMVVYGVSFAIFQTDMRRMLSYLIVSQVGYMVAGIGLADWPGITAQISSLAFDGGLAHLFNDVIYKALLFMTVGVIIWQTGENTLGRLGGLLKKMPITAFAFIVAALSISDVPLFNGYVSKGMVVVAAAQVNGVIWILLEIGAFETALALLKLGYFAFLGKGTVDAKDPPLSVEVAMVGAAILCIALGVYPQLLYQILPFAVTGYQPYNTETILTSLVVLGAAVLTFFAVGRKYLAPREMSLRDFDGAYVALGHGVIVFAGALQGVFGSVYGFITDRLVPCFSKFAGRMQTGLLSINGLFMLGALIIVLLAVAFWEL